MKHEASIDLANEPDVHCIWPLNLVVPFFGICRPESDFLTTIIPLSDDLDRLYELCRRCLSSYD